MPVLARVMVIFQKVHGERGTFYETSTFMKMEGAIWFQHKVELFEFVYGLVFFGKQTGNHLHLVFLLPMNKNFAHLYQRGKLLWYNKLPSQRYTVRMTCPLCCFVCDRSQTSG